MLLRQILSVVCGGCLFVGCASAQSDTITLATYNIEHFNTRFEGYRLSKLPEAQQPGLVKDLVDAEKKQNEEDQWEIAQVISDPAFNPDILVIEEGCTESNLKYFNKRWLNEAYETVVVFPTNTDHEQHLGMMLKPGFKIIERREHYREEKDVIPNDRGGFLFARGPAFCLIETPGGYRFWVGVTHQKSKSGNSVEITAWRNREAKRTHEIMLELQKTGPDDVMLLGDMNDDLGVGQYEDDPNSGGDTIANLVGSPADSFVLATESLAKSGEISFGGYWNTKYRSFIDHVVTTASMKDQVEKVAVFKSPFTSVASDHYPVLVKLRSDAPASPPVEKPKPNP